MFTVRKLPKMQITLGFNQTRHLRNGMNPIEIPLKCHLLVG